LLIALSVLSLTWGSLATQHERRRGAKIVAGSLAISELGEAYALTWVGRQLAPEHRDARYIGIGILETGGFLVASFEEDPAYPLRATLREQFDRLPGPNGERSQPPPISAMLTPIKVDWN
jgi:hypothetical protein